MMRVIDRLAVSNEPALVAFGVALSVGVARLAGVL
jgi:hypothetical protein